MNSPDTLFDHPATAGRARATDPQTSVEAARRTRAGSTRAAILDAFARYPTLTDDELCFLMPHRNPPTVKTARSALAKEGRLIDSGQRRPSEHGVDQIAWAKPYRTLRQIAQEAGTFPEAPVSSQEKP